MPGNIAAMAVGGVEGTQCHNSTRLCLNATTRQPYDLDNYKLSESVSFSVKIKINLNVLPTVAVRIKCNEKYKFMASCLELSRCSIDIQSPSCLAIKEIAVL